ncbi:caspase Dronc-like [Anopheles ziemanni]|uniref:caspase Dronc-like n=1 Tax=Anopheles coustani TaxID=139045 RepID=UPI002659DD4F|nr:caspase Dronc-like [Anopheles coustani]XP_058170111.1 caspase Dronc-like [Anopheles ziemanni]
MENKHREAIISRMDALIHCTNYEALCNECIQRNMLSRDMVLRIESLESDAETRHKRLFEKITKRGPKAFDILLDICRRQFPPAYTELQRGFMPPFRRMESNDAKMNSTLNPNRVRPVTPNEAVELATTRCSEESANKENNNAAAASERVTGSNSELSVHERIPPPFIVKQSSGPPSTQPWVTTYPMANRNKGVAFILNMISFVNDTLPERKGATVDGKNLISLFQQLGFQVFYNENVTLAKYKELVAKLKSSNHLPCDCFVFYILSHGKRHEDKDSDYIFLYDTSLLRIQDILVEFSAQECKKLIDKPKLFFFSVCRGENSDLGSHRLARMTERDGVMLNRREMVPINTPTYCDMLLCYATVPGFAALRDPSTGSWFVESMCRVWAKHAHEMDVETMMKLVGKDTASNRTNALELQTISTEQRGFFHHLYLNPGYYADSQDKLAAINVARFKSLKSVVKLSRGPTKTQPSVTTYPMTSRNRGVAFIVNIISFVNKDYTERRGAKIDGQNLISLFQQLGFKVFYYETLTKAQYKALMAQLKTSNYLSCDCFVFYILSHGLREEKTNRDLIAFHDCSHLAVQDILAEFSTKNCTKLIGKPKLFFFSVCRGNDADFGFDLSRTTEHDGARLKASDPVSVNIPTFCDMMLCYATVPGFAALRDSNTGSWFVESMCKVWAEYAHEMDVETMMKLVGKVTATNRTNALELQTICTEQWGFFHQLFLNPGYYEFAQDERS